MNSYNSKEKFLLIKDKSHYLRVDDSHPLELLIGLNDLGNKTIRFIGNFQKAKVRSTKSIEVNHYVYKDKFIVSFSLIDESFVDLFYLFCNDLIDSSRKISQDNGYIFLINRFERWRTFIGISRKFLSENEIKGLIGELLFLRNFLFDKYGYSKAIQGWTGTEPLKKDFSYDNNWYEIKSTVGETIFIASIEQLESNFNGYLIVYVLEKMSPESNGITLNKLVNEILSIIELDIDKQEFIIKLVQANFYNEEYYEQFVYDVKRVNIYRVDETFPKINQTNLDIAITNVKYEIIVNMLEQYKVENI